MIRPITNFLSHDKIKQEIARLQYNPNSYDSLSNAAEVCVKNKHWIEALYILDQIIEDYGATSQLHVNKSLCNYRLQEYEEALESLELALELEPENQYPIKLKAMIEQKIDRLAKYWGVQMYA